MDLIFRKVKYKCHVCHCSFRTLPLTLGVDGLTVKVGQPAALVYHFQDYNVSSSSHRACRFYKNDAYFGVIGRGESKGNCTNTEICENKQFLIEQVINAYHAVVKIPHTRVNDGGNYTVYCVSSGSTNASHFKKLKQLYVIEGKLITINRCQLCH